jgi:hypothetical protein
MPDMIAIAQALNALKAAKDIAETMIGLRDTAAFQGKLLEFQSKIIDANNAAFAAQEERSTLLQKIGDLEAEVARLEAWETEKQRYDLKDLGFGAIAYVIKPDMQGSEPVHCICANCYEKGQKVHLQNTGRIAEPYGSGFVWRCPNCASEIHVTALNTTNAT